MKKTFKATVLLITLVSFLAISCNNDGVIPEPEILFELRRSESIESFTQSFNYNFTTIDKDGDSIDNWGVHHIDDKFRGFGSWSFVNNYGATNPENYLILPPLNITKEGRFKFTAYANDGNDFREKFKVIISDSPITEDNCRSAEVLLIHTLEGCRPEAYLADIAIPSSYDGKTVYIGICHFDCTNQYMLIITDLEVTHTGR